MGGTRLHDLLPRQPRPPATLNNGINVSLDNESCQAKGVDGVPLPGSVNGYTPVCDDASVNLRILQGDMNLDCVVDVVDEQAMEFHYGACDAADCWEPWRRALYSPWFDLEPQVTDGDTDIKDSPVRVWSPLEHLPASDTVSSVRIAVHSGGSAPATLPSEPEATLLEGGTNVVVDPPSRNLPAVGQQFTADLRVENVTNLGAYQFTLQFDPNVVSYVGTSDGSFLGSTGSWVDCLSPIVDAGMVHFVCATQGSQSQRPSGSGQLAHVTFQSVGEGSSPLHLADVIVVDPTGAYITSGVADGSVSVNDSDGDGVPNGSDNCPSIQPRAGGC